MRARSAGLSIEIFPIGQPGKVSIVLENLGPEPLSSHETLLLLRQAQAIVQLRIDQGDKP